MRLTARFCPRGPAPVARALLSTCLLLGCLLASPRAGQAGDVVRVGGTGMALAAVQRLGQQLSAANPDIVVEVLPSLGTPGGIKAMLEGAIDIAVAARAPTPAEREKGASEAACMTTALVFASSHARPGNLTRQALPAVFADPVPAWPDGVPLKIILRSRAGTENPYLGEKIPGMAAALDSAYRRGGIPVGATDQENAELAHRTAGSLAIMSLLQIRAENLDLRVATLDGVKPGAASLADGSYPLPVRVCLLLSRNPSATARRLIAQMQSPPGQALLRELEARPSE